MPTTLAAATSVAVVGLGFGDEGKGSILDALARRLNAGAVVRFNGGPQAAHHVVTDDGRTHCFAQFGSAMLVHPQIVSASGPRVLVEPLALGREAAALEHLGVPCPLGRLHLDERSVVVTPFHRLINRALELSRGAGRHGSCGLGVGPAYVDSLDPGVATVRLGELRDEARGRRKLDFIRRMKLDLAEQLQAQAARASAGHPEAGPRDAPATVADELAAVVADLRRTDLVDATLAGYRPVLAALGSLGVFAPPGPSGPTLYEGAQGVLLDEHHGFWPHVTPSTTTFASAEELATPRPFRLGLLRAFVTRHGAGPFVSELPADESLRRGEHNALNPWQGAFRVGWFDLVLARHALTVAGGVDGLALTCLDRLAGRREVGLVTAWRHNGDSAEVADLFVFERGLITAIAPEPHPTRQRQQRLTEALARCTPEVELVAGWTDHGQATCEQFVARLERELNAPVVVRSVGPTASSKHWTPA